MAPQQDWMTPNVPYFKSLNYYKTIYVRRKAITFTFKTVDLEALQKTTNNFFCVQIHLLNTVLLREPEQKKIRQVIKAAC